MIVEIIGMAIGSSMMAKEIVELQEILKKWIKMSEVRNTKIVVILRKPQVFLLLQDAQYH